MTRVPIRLGAIDLGTTGVRFVLYDEQGYPLATAYRELPLSTPHPGWVEQDAEILLASTLTVMNEVLGQQEAVACRLCAIGLANQRETVVAWDRETGRPLHPAIVWQDRRTADRCDALRTSDRAESISERTGLSIDPYFSASKMEWLLEHVPDLRAKAKSGSLLFGTVDAWILWQLTGRHATDATNASRTMLLDLEACAWDDALLREFGIPRESLPEVLPSLSMFGTIKPEYPGGGTTLAGILGDQQASLLGQGVISSGSAQVTWGTGAFLLTNTGNVRTRSNHGLLTTIARTGPSEPPAFALEGAVFVAGAAIQWLRDALGLFSSASETSELAQRVDSAEGVVFVPAFTGLGSPHWDARARGLVIGMTQRTRREHLVRAALEAIAYQTLDVVRAMEADMECKIGELRVGGGGAANDFLCQFQSDLLEIPLVRPQDPETTALGAAFAAGLAVGLWDDVLQVATLARESRRFEPAIADERRERWIGQWHRAVERAKGWAVEETEEA